LLPVDADLGGRVFEQRVALPGRGKSGSLRTLRALTNNFSGFNQAAGSGNAAIGAVG